MSSIHDSVRLLVLLHGTLALAEVTPEGLTVHARASLFSTTSWTVPTLVGTTLYARDRAEIVALDLGVQ